MTSTVSNRRPPDDVNHRLHTALAIAVGIAVGVGLTLITRRCCAARRPSVRWPARTSATRSRRRIGCSTRSWGAIRRDYVEPVPDTEFEEAAVEGVVASLDPHSAFLDAEQYDEMRVNTAGSYSGVGIEVSATDGRIVVVTPIEGSPAARAGVRSGDVILAVDDHARDGRTARRDDRAHARVGRLARAPGGGSHRRAGATAVHARAHRGPRAQRARRAVAGRLRVRACHAVHRLDAGGPGPRRSADSPEPGRCSPCAGSCSTCAAILAACSSLPSAWPTRSSTRA